jgi:hypothetical protein
VVTTTNKNEGSDPNSRNVVLNRLEASEVTVGLYGRTVVRLTPLAVPYSSKPLDDRADSSTHPDAAAAPITAKADKSVPLLPAHRFTTGDEVEVRTSSKTEKKANISGVICEVTDASISVALSSSKETRKLGGDSKKPTKGKGVGDKKASESGHDDVDAGFIETLMADNSGPLSLIPRSSVDVHQKMLQALADLESHGTQHPAAGPIVQALFDHELVQATLSCQKPSSAPDAEPSGSNDNPDPASSPFISPAVRKLDPSQQEAVRFALGLESSPGPHPIALIHG